jgi:RNA polymerase sigma factor (sigma-70 family)
VAFEDRSIEMLALGDVLERLARLDPRQAQVVELRFFCGLTHKEIAETLSVSERTVKDDWFTAKAWIHRELVKDGGDTRPHPEGEHDA